MKQTSLINFFFIKVKYFSVFQAGLIELPEHLRIQIPSPSLVSVGLE